MKKNHKQFGFTLIEIIIYIALFSLLLGTAFIAAYQLIQSSGGLDAKNIIAEEGNFVTRKINWVLTGANLVTSPASDTSSNSLSLTKDGNVVSFTYNPATFILSLGGIELNNSRIKLLVPTSNPLFIFTHTSSGVNPESVTARFTLQMLSPSGHTDSQDFEITKYLRK